MLSPRKRLQKARQKRQYRHKIVSLVIGQVVDAETAKDFERVHRMHRRRSGFLIAVMALALTTAATIGLIADGLLFGLHRRELVGQSLAQMAALMFNVVALAYYVSDPHRRLVMLLWRTIVAASEFRDGIRWEQDVRPVVRSLRAAAHIAEVRLARKMRLGRPAGREVLTAIAIAKHLRGLADAAVGPDREQAQYVYIRAARFAVFLTRRAAWLDFPNEDGEVIEPATGRLIAWVRNILASALIVGSVALPLVPLFRPWAIVGAPALALCAAGVLGGARLLETSVQQRLAHTNTT